MQGAGLNHIVVKCAFQDTKSIAVYQVKLRSSAGGQRVIFTTSTKVLNQKRARFPSENARAFVLESDKRTTKKRHCPSSITLKSIFDPINPDIMRSNLVLTLSLARGVVAGAALMGAGFMRPRIMRQANLDVSNELDVCNPLPTSVWSMFMRPMDLLLIAEATLGWAKHQARGQFNMVLSELVSTIGPYLGTQKTAQSNALCLTATSIPQTLRCIILIKWIATRRRPSA